MRSRDNRNESMELLPEELKDPEGEMVRFAQRNAFCDEYTALSSGKPIPKKSQLIKLNPCIDDDGVIRSDGRLKFAGFLPYDTRFPFILPRGHWHYHERGNHAAGVNFTLCQLSERFWIIAAREEIREWDRECNECKRRRNKPACQIMAPLPQMRLRFSFRPFAQTAVDFAGPFYTVQRRGKPRQKRWLCLFTFLETRAVHLEMAWGLDTDTFLNAFARFTSRRGVPKEVTSDRGTNFLGAEGELKKLVRRLDRKHLQNKTAELGVTCRFNPLAAPHFGGAHEIMVKAAKKATYATVGKRDVNDEELITVFAGVESLLNSHGKVCTVIRAYGARKGNYFECGQPVTGTRLLITWSTAFIQYIQLCEVEVFQTKIINLAGKRPTKSSKNEKESYRGNDQKLDKPFSTGVRPRSKEIQWWSVDLIALCKIHLVRILTASGYKPQHLRGLKILIDSGENAFGRGRRVARLDSPTEEPVQTITLSKNVKVRFVTLALQNGGLELQFREVEIYNGPLLEIKECIPPCAAENSFCDKYPGSYKCKCPHGFEPTFGDKGILLRCQDIDECAIKDSCHVNASCSNTPGSYKCTCSHGLGGDGYKPCLKLPRCPSGQCRENAVCKEFKGIKLCDCKEGYHFNGKMCVEVNECEKREICGDTAVCEDIFGSYKCNCPDGFSFDKTQKKCVDNDECTISHSCPSNMICTNTFGSYSCSCRQGYRSDKFYCADIDECEEDRYDCPKFSRCKNQNGSYECPCKDGYRKAPDGTCSGNASHSFSDFTPRENVFFYHRAEKFAFQSVKKTHIVRQESVCARGAFLWAQT
ncbi:EGF-like module-containing mucin-like hormone receptor-like 1 [Stylophora pistillata]|uniref:EGF-like module-containing mucin-like hormone receptor-like 1 n=1 Tax=Stylophora pistillata TaxID=50429 RepID=A0A2B4RP16_STYPI|nr:EGF-like module-containing mucin-like hormone receptor-like 1 [Stylophora pistillata]